LSQSKSNFLRKIEKNKVLKTIEVSEDKQDNKEQDDDDNGNNHDNPDNKEEHEHKQDFTASQEFNQNIDLENIKDDYKKLAE